MNFKMWNQEQRDYAGILDPTGYTTNKSNLATTNTDTAVKSRKD